jgi:phenylacetate-CoA ligase
MNDEMTTCAKQEMPTSADEAPISRVFKIKGTHRLQFWESEATRPKVSGASGFAHVALEEMTEETLPGCLHHPFRSPDEIRRGQFERVRELVELAYRDVPLYADKYRAVGFEPGDLKSWEDFERLPVVTKDELVEAGPARCVSSRFPVDDLFATRTFGTSGRTVIIKVDARAIMVDTIQGVRQLMLQSGMRYRPDHLTAHFYTVPWWFETIGDDHRTAFISGLIAPPTVGRILDEVNPHVLSCYPTNLKALLPYWKGKNATNRYLAIVHSETSSAEDRRRWSRELGIPVLDEYSSEEATRIALELPCGHYHVCDDTVNLEVLDPVTREPRPDGELGIAVVTNLLNEAMPFIRYVQGDHVTRPRSPGSCMVKWSQLETINGRVNDGFVSQHGRQVPAGAILDLAYRWMFDANVHIKEFELVQKAPGAIKAVLMVDGEPQEKVGASFGHLRELLSVCLGHPVEVDVELVKSFPVRTGKRRPIRREFAA